MKIDSAPPEQWEEIDRIRQWWIDQQTVRQSDEQIRSVVRQMWQRIDAASDEPVVLIVDSPLAAVLAGSLLSCGEDQLSDQLGNQLEGQLRVQLESQLWGQLRDQLGAQLESQLRDQLWSQLWGQLRDQLGNQLEPQLWGQLRDQLGAQLGAQLRDQLWSQLEGQLGAQLRDQLWSQLEGQLGAQLRVQLRSQLRGQSQPMAWSLWRQAWAAHFEGAKVLGVEFNDEVYGLFRDWCLCVPFVVPYASMAIVSRRPEFIAWQDGRLHCEDGPAVRFRDGYSTYSLSGVLVDRQIVESPESQTVQQINKEENEEVKRLRIERYGWSRYLTEVGAEEIDRRDNLIEATREQLLRCGEMLILRTFCPSTGKVFALEVDPSVTTCAGAQSWLWSIDDSETAIVGRT